MPKVSIIMPTYNRHELIKKSINSILKQSYKDWELIIIDDCPEYPAKRIVKRYDDERIKYIEPKENRGGAAARNAGIRISQGSIIGFIDDDDEWLPDKLTLQMEVFEHTSNDVGFCYSAAFVVKDDKVARTVVPEGISDYFERALTRFAGFLGITVLIKNYVFDDVGLWDESLPSHQEIELIIRITKKYKGLSMNIPLTRSTIGEEREQIASDLSKRVKGRELLLKKYWLDFKARPKLLAKHYFQIALWYRDMGSYINSRENFKHSLKASFKFSCFLHYISMMFGGSLYRIFKFLR